MRPQQQNRRMRGRGNNNNRKGPNPLTRSYESNGPDVKIRGTAQQIADKYATLARDAQSSGDRVMAENYLQHAEHYNRIIAAAQAQQQLQQQQQNARDMREDADDDMDERDEFEPTSDRGERNGRRLNDGSGPQPVIEGMPAEIALKESENRRLSGNGQHHTNGNGAASPEEGSDQPAPQEEAAKGEEVVSEAAAEEEAPRRPRRPRRPRSRTGDTPEAEGQAPHAEQDASQSQ